MMVQFFTNTIHISRHDVVNRCVLQEHSLCRIYTVFSLKVDFVFGSFFYMVSIVGFNIVSYQGFRVIRRRLIVEIWIEDTLFISMVSHIHLKWKGIISVRYTRNRWCKCAGGISVRVPGVMNEFRIIEFVRKSNFYASHISYIPI